MNILDFIRYFDKETQEKAYLQFKKDLNVTYQGYFEDWLEENFIDVQDEWVYNDGSYTKCDGCGKWLEEDDEDWCHIDSITSGGLENICQECVNDGYGS